LFSRYTNIDLRKDVSDGMAIRAELGKMIGRTSVPAIWIQQQYIGGCNDGGPNNIGIRGLNDNGQLDVMLQKAGVL
jgi:glutaredoxin 3